MAQSGFWWILFFGALFGLLHSLLASNHAKGLSSKLFGASFRSHYRLFYVVVAGVTSLAYFGSFFLFPDRQLYRLHPPFIYLTLIIQLAAGIGFIVALFQTNLLAFAGLASFSGKPSRADTLTTGGFYRYTRHPIYLFSLILLWLLPYMSWNLLALAIGVTVYTLIGSLMEERRLAQQFGQEYLEYKKRTPWLIPIRFK